MLWACVSQGPGIDFSEIRRALEVRGQAEAEELIAAMWSTGVGPREYWSGSKGP